jgi:hypothetical protein
VVNTEYNYFDYTEVDDFGASVSIDFENRTCLQAIRDTVSNTDWVFFVDKD